MPTVMLVDDAKFMRMVLKDIITSIGGYEVVGECDDGSKVLDEYKRCKPDIVLMDIVMKYSGIDATRDLKQFDEKAKILIVSALGGEEALVNEAVKVGAEKRIVTKPFKKEEIEEVLNTIL
ncbi:MAG TPA: response regulator [Thermoplasmata archaeon]|nr:response regulator [Thermoplasmata archaeon]